MNISIGLICIVLHVVSDFWLQIACQLNKMKRKVWWRGQIDSVTPLESEQKKLWKKYRFDYIPALVLHCISWSVITFAPLSFSCTTDQFTAIVAVNTIVHYVIDDLKANWTKINLCVDQLLHVMQIIATIEIMRYL